MTDPLSFRVVSRYLAKSAKGIDYRAIASASKKSREAENLLKDMESLKAKVDQANGVATKKFDNAYEKLDALGHAMKHIAGNVANSLQYSSREDATTVINLINQDWRQMDSYLMSHHRASGKFAHDKLLQAKQTQGMIWSLNEKIQMASKL